MKQYVFVYGTLKRGLGNNRVLGKSAFVGNGTTVKPMEMRDTGGFPVVFPNPQTGHIKGEVFEVDDDRVMQNLDWLEGVPNLFQHHKTIVDTDTVGPVECLMYVGSASRWAPDAIPLSKQDAEGCFFW